MTSPRVRRWLTRLVVLGAAVSAFSVAWAVNAFRRWQAFALDPEVGPVAGLTVQDQETWMTAATLALGALTAVMVALAVLVLTSDRPRGQPGAVRRPDHASGSV